MDGVFDLAIHERQLLVQVISAGNQHMHWSDVDCVYLISNIS